MCDENVYPDSFQKAFCDKFKIISLFLRDIMSLRCNNYIVANMYIFFGKKRIAFIFMGIFIANLRGNLSPRYGGISWVGRGTYDMGNLAQIEMS